MAAERSERWPQHRKHHDSALESLELALKQQAHELELLQQRIAKLEAASRALAPVTPAPVTPAPVTPALVTPAPRTPAPVKPQTSLP